MAFGVYWVERRVIGTRNEAIYKLISISHELLVGWPQQACIDLCPINKHAREARIFFITSAYLVKKSYSGEAIPLLFIALLLSFKQTSPIYEWFCTEFRSDGYNKHCAYVHSCAAARAPITQIADARENLFSSDYVFNLNRVAATLFPLESDRRNRCKRKRQIRAQFAFAPLRPGRWETNKSREHRTNPVLINANARSGERCSSINKRAADRKTKASVVSRGAFFISSLRFSYGKKLNEFLFNLCLACDLHFSSCVFVSCFIATNSRLEHLPFASSNTDDIDSGKKKRRISKWASSETFFIFIQAKINA